MLLSSTCCRTFLSRSFPGVGGEEGVCASKVVHKMDAAASSADCNGGSGKKGPWLLAMLGKGTAGCEAVTLGCRALVAGRTGVCRLVRRVRRRGDSGTRFG
ncbi:hypothetical protein HPB50_025748 [Hyalomma asiaticum]|uniref:Uncharacterized protein n=1 Tax=Hyalomma asiaticum TaxID=266040 RepID=A0ACB7SPJ3_HYAAI|nr:hypothetical protein HPB50_025748 [Hyalomma asiaticum]